MKKSKFIYILIVTSILLLCALTMGIYSQVLFHQLNKTVNSPEIIDIAVNSIDEATEMLNDLSNFKNIRNISFICSAVLVVAIVILIVAFVKGDAIKAKIKAIGEKKKNKSPKPKKISGYTPPVPQKSETDSTPAVNVPGQKGYCQNCGKFYEELPVFCGDCGQNTT